MEKTTKHLSVESFCNFHQIDIHFIGELADFGLIKTKQIEKEIYIPTKELPVVEKYIRLNQELEINPAGLQAIAHLLNKLEDLQSKIFQLEDRLNYFEKD